MHIWILGKYSLDIHTYLQIKMLVGHLFLFNSHTPHACYCNTAFCDAFTIAKPTN